MFVAIASKENVIIEAVASERLLRSCALRMFVDSHLAPADILMEKARRETGCGANTVAGPGQLKWILGFLPYQGSETGGFYRASAVGIDRRSSLNFFRFRTPHIGFDYCESPRLINVV